MMVSAVFMLFLVLPIHSQATVADGTYSLSYQVNKPGSNAASMANDYFLKPAKLTVNNGKMTVQLTIKNSAWVTEFNPPGGATVISSNPAADQRIVQFNVSSLNALTVAMKIDIDDIDYHHAYSVDFVFDGAGLPEAQPNTTTPPSNTTNNQSSSGSNTSSNKQPSQNNEVATNNSSSNEQQKPTDNEVNTSQNEVANSNGQDVESSEEVENPETSDALPLMYIVAFMAAAILFIRTKQPRSAGGK